MFLFCRFGSKSPLPTPNSKQPTVHNMPHFRSHSRCPCSSAGDPSLSTGHHRCRCNPVIIIAAAQSPASFLFQINPSPCLLLHRRRSSITACNSKAQRRHPSLLQSPRPHAVLSPASSTAFLPYRCASPCRRRDVLLCISLAAALKKKQI